ncbi:MAG: AhpC/TSA family protein [Anaerolineales bacterium]|nr:AhpC/TSA family protein [Anaerolineales bacterium]
MDEFEQTNTQVLIITFGTLLGAESWLKETCSSFRLLLDPERKVYQAYGLERSLLRSWNLRTIWTYGKLLASGRKWRGIQGDSAQLGGDFIIDSLGKIHLAYRSYDPTDRPSVQHLLAIMRSIHSS